MKFTSISKGFAVAALGGLVSLAAVSDQAQAGGHGGWSPKGPINLMIAFAAGGGADTQARLIASEIEKKKGWKILPSNVTGKGGVTLARKMKSEPNDGQTIGIAVTESFNYSMAATKNAGYSLNDFTFITTTAGSQMGVYGKTDKGWKSWDDVVKAAKGGKTIKIGGMSPKHADLIYLLGQKAGVKFNPVILRGGKKVLNAVTAGDVDLGFGAGIQNRAVKAGTMTHYISGELTRLKASPNVPTLKEMGLPYDGGAKFLIFAPKGIPADARVSIAAAVAEALNTKGTKLDAFVTKAFGGPQLITGPALDKLLKDGLESSKALMKASG